MIRIVGSKDVGRILKRRAARMTEAEETVKPILEAVRTRGDKALVEYAKKFDQLDRKSVAVPQQELEAARKRLPAEFRRAVKEASKNIRAYAKLQLPEAKSRTVAPGLKLGQIVRPLDTVAAYIPGGRYPLPSTFMMTVIPAQVAGVANVCACSPRPVDEVLGTAAQLKVDRFFQMGGAHAIAAFAYGTRTVPQADRIVGPGNIYVAAAKKLLAGEVGIDFIAGPTEILLIAAVGNPRWIAADMLAQAEHDVDASIQSIVRAGTLDGKAPAGTIDMETLSRLLLSTLGVENVDAVIDQMFAGEPSEEARSFVEEVKHFRETINALIEAAA